MRNAEVFVHRVLDRMDHLAVLDALDNRPVEFADHRARRMARVQNGVVLLKENRRLIDDAFFHQPTRVAVADDFFHENLSELFGYEDLIRNIQNRLMRLKEIGWHLVRMNMVYALAAAFGASIDRRELPVAVFEVLQAPVTGLEVRLRF